MLPVLEGAGAAAGAVAGVTADEADGVSAWAAPESRAKARAKQAASGCERMVSLSGERVCCSAVGTRNGPSIARVFTRSELGFDAAMPHNETKIK
jgi:hypothetical protein